MARKRPHDRIGELILCAATVFTERGYRRTQMADVAKAMGVAPGTLYLYVASKEALFDLVVQRGFVDHAATPSLPIATPAPGATLAHVRQRFAEETTFPKLSSALARRGADPRAEFEAIVRELYATLARNWRVLKLLERSALDWPELGQLYFLTMRRGVIGRLTKYVERRVDQGVFRSLPHPAVAARLVLETIAWSAVHRQRDQDPFGLEEESVETTVVDLLVHSLLRKRPA